MSFAQLPFSGINVPETLRAGLAGLCFLLALFSFWLIYTEQKREGPPRNGIIKMIYAFMSVNVVSSLLCFFGGSGPHSTPELQGDYVIEHTSYTVDLSQWQPGKGVPVVVTRTDRIRKNTSFNKDFIIPFSTTGSDIKCTPLDFKTQPDLVKKDDPLATGTHYDYVLRVGHQPIGYTEIVTSRFIFPDGFRDSTKEWWASSVPYFAKVITVDFLFPDNKPAKTLSVRSKSGSANFVAITDNPATLYDKGVKAKWVGHNQEARSRVQFDWTW